MSRLRWSSKHSGAVKGYLIRRGNGRSAFDVSRLRHPATAARVADPCSDEAFVRYRPWFYAAAFYNFVWGTATVLFPKLYFDIVGIEHPNYLPIWQVAGMFVLVYAPA